MEKDKELYGKIEQTKKELDSLQARIKELGGILQEEEEKSFQQIAREKTEEVKEKMKKGKKLSTEDILAFQAMKD